MKIKTLEKNFNKEDFKSRVSSLFPKEVSKKIELKVSISHFAGNLIKCSVKNESINQNENKIPNLFAIVPYDVPKKKIQKKVISQFKELVATNIFKN